MMKTGPRAAAAAVTPATAAVSRSSLPTVSPSATGTADRAPEPRARLNSNIVSGPGSAAETANTTVNNPT